MKLVHGFPQQTNGSNTSGDFEFIAVSRQGVRVLPLPVSQIDYLVANDPYYAKVAGFFADRASGAEIQVDCSSPTLQAELKKKIAEWKRLFVKAQKKADAHGSWCLIIETGDRNFQKPIRTGTKKFSLFLADRALTRSEDRLSYQLAGRTLAGKANDFSIHASRVLEFTSRSDGESVIRQFHRYWVLYRTALERITGLLVRKDFVTMRREGLTEEIEESEDPDTFLEQILSAGMLAIEQQGLLLVDARNELEIHSRDLTGSDLITRQLRQAAIGASGGISESDLFGSRDKSGNLTSSDRADREKQGEIADRIVRDYWLPHLETLVLILGYSKLVTLVSKGSNQPTTDEQLERVRRYAEVDKLYLEMAQLRDASGKPVETVLSAAEIRTRFINGWSTDLILDPKHPLNHLESETTVAPEDEEIDIQLPGEAEESLAKI